MDTADLQPGATVGEYQIERVIGEGSFGKVYAAVHPMIGKRAAIKVLGFEHSHNPQFVSRFLEEARAVNKIRHRNIVDIFSMGKLPDGRQYLVMELLDGKPMGDWLEERGAIPVPEALPILRKVAKALDAAHKQNIAHRDLKPDNIFLTFDDDGIVFPVLLDFGIAKLMGDSPMGHKTQTGTPMGTPLYMSPEQCRGSQMDHRTDIYSFGIVIFEMLTGKRPFDSENVMEILMAHLSQTPPTMSTVAPSLPAALDPPVQKMLEKDPERRPPTILIAINALIAAARSVGIAVPSSREVSMSGMRAFGATAPMSGEQSGAADTVPETPATDPRPRQPTPQQPTAQQPTPQQPTTKESYAYPAPPTAHSPRAVVGSTNVDSSLEPVGAPIPAPPTTHRARKRGTWTYVLGGLVLATLLVGGLFAAGLIEIEYGTSKSETEPDDDDSRDDDSADEPDSPKTGKPADGKDAPKNGTKFGNTVLLVGGSSTTNESIEMAFTVVEDGEKILIARAHDQKSRFDVLATSDAGVTKGRVTFEHSVWTESRNHGTPNKDEDDRHGNVYVVAGTGGEPRVEKPEGSLSNSERKEVKRHAAGLLGPNLFAQSVSGKTVAPGERIALPFNTAMYLLREYDKVRFPKLTGSITFDKIVDNWGDRAGEFSVQLDVQYEDDDGSVAASELTGKVMIDVKTGRVTSVSLQGPLNITEDDVTYEPGTFKYTYTTSYTDGGI